jgi:predicted O-methyltransferase YrrM
MDLTEQKIIEYAETISEIPDKILYDLYRETHLNVMNPIMLTGFVQGKLLEMISRMTQAEKILEIGTYTGFSAICLARGMKECGMLHTIEKNEELEDICRKYFAIAKVEHLINLHIGDASKVIENSNEIFDLVYIDGEKSDYLKWYEMVLPKVRKGGLILADNVLWHGKIIDTDTSSDTDTRSIQQFNEAIKNDERVTNLLLPFRDGLMIIIKN